MAKACSVASWNVEHLKGTDALRDKWISEYSDRSLLFFVVERV